MKIYIMCSPGLIIMLHLVLMQQNK